MKLFFPFIFLFLLLCLPFADLSAQRTLDPEALNGLGVEEIHSTKSFTSSSFPDIISLGTTGFLLDTYFESHRRIIQGVEQTESHSLVIRDTLMQNLFKATHRIPAACRVMATQVNGSKIRLAYAVPEKSFRVYVVSVDLELRVSWYSVYESPLKGIQEISFWKDQLIAVGDERFQCGVWNLDLETGLGVPHFFNMGDESKLLGAQIDAERQELWLLYKGAGWTTLQRCNLKGGSLEPARITWGVEEEPRTANLSLENGRPHFAGTYSQGRRSPIAGFFLYTPSARGNNVSILPFSEFQGLRALLTDEDEKGNRKVKRRLEKGKELDLPHEVLLHSVQADDENLVWTLELVRPVFKTETYYEEGMDDRNESKTREVFLGWRNEYVLVVGTDDNGRYLWDHAFSMNSEVEGRLQKRALLISEKDSLQLFMVREKGVWKEKLVKAGETWKKKPSSEIRLENGGKLGSAVPWYGSTMIGYVLDGIGNASGTAWHSITSLWKVTP